MERVNSLGYLYQRLMKITIPGLNFPWYRHWHPSMCKIYELSKHCSDQREIIKSSLRQYCVFFAFKLLFSTWYLLFIQAPQARVFSDIFDRTRRNQMCWRSITMRYEKKMKVFSKKGYGLFSQCFPAWGWFSRALTFLSLYYPLGKMGTISGLKPGSMFWSFALFSFVLICFILSFHSMRTCTTTMTSAICPSWTEVNQRLL